MSGSNKSSRKAAGNKSTNAKSGSGKRGRREPAPTSSSEDSSAEDTTAEETGRYAYDGLDRVLHEKARLGIVTSLAARTEGILFGDLKALCNLTDGNLSRHLTVLQDADIVEIQKGYRGRRPQTLCQLTEEGRRRYLAYIAVLESVLDDAGGASRAARGARRMPDGWSPA